MDAILSEMVPLAGIAMIVLVVVIPVWLRTHYASQDRKHLHETVRMMVEKGQPVSSEMLESLNNRSGVVSDGPARSGSSADIRRGVILIMVGLGLVALGAALGPVSDWEAFGPLAGSGAFPGFIGLGFVIIGLLNRSKPKA
jgi:ABC-type uncharacterized transport system permease subunit